MNLPEGIGVLPFMLPGSPVLMEATVAGLREHRVVLWSKHGVMAHSDQPVTRAADRIEYVEMVPHLNASTAEGRFAGLRIQEGWRLEPADSDQNSSPSRGVKMEKEREPKDDGRYIIFYHFQGEGEEEEE